MMRWNSVSSTDSASSVRLGVSGEHRPLRMPHCKSACKRWRSAAEAKPRTYCIQEFANNTRAVNTMYGFPTKSLRSKDSKGMHGLCTSTDNRRDMFTDRHVATDCNA